MKPLLLALCLFAICPAWAVIQRDLGQGLNYVRISDLSKDAEELKNALTKEAVVLDLRNTIATPEATAALNLQLNEIPPGMNGVRLILINPTSAAEIVQAVSLPRPRTLTVGPRTPALFTDIAVPTPVDEDRRAYDALADDTPIDGLISSNPGKKRFDEAALTRTHTNGAAAPVTDDAGTEDGAERVTSTPPPSPSTAASKPVEAAASAAPAAAPAGKKPPVRHDLVLERAVQLHRALLALKNSP